MRRLPAFLLLCSSLVLAGVAGPPPKATPTPAAAATPAPARAAIPLVVVFPFQTSTDLKADTGQRAAQLFVDQMNQAGGIDAILAPGSVPRANYLSYTGNLRADYYLTGYMTPLGNGVSLVEQVVSTQSGAIVYGATAEIDSFDDASSQALQIHGALLALEQSDAERYSSAQAESTSTPAPANQANLSRGFSDLAGLFKRHGATPRPAAVQKPSKGVIVVRASGSVPANDLSTATTQMYDSLNTYFNARMTPAVASDLSKQADSICGTSRDNTVATGSLAATVQHHGLGSRTQWTFTLDIYTCFGAKLAQSDGASDSLDGAVKAAVDAYAKAHPGNS